MDGAEIIRRVQLIEGRLADFTASRLSPFNQQEIMARLDEVEQKLQQQPGRMQRQATAQGDAVADILVIPDAGVSASADAAPPPSAEDMTQAQEEMDSVGTFPSAQQVSDTYFCHHRILHKGMENFVKGFLGLCR